MSRICRLNIFLRYLNINSIRELVFKILISVSGAAICGVAEWVEEQGHVVVGLGVPDLKHNLQQRDIHIQFYQTPKHKGVFITIDVISA